MKAPAEPVPHRLELELASGARLRVLAHSDRDWSMEFRYTLDERDQPHGEVLRWCEHKAFLRYEAGEPSPELSVTLNVVIPGRLGQEFLAGMDVSPGAKAFVELDYQRNRDGDAYLLREVRCGRRRWEVRQTTDQPALLRQVEFPYPVTDVVRRDLGKFRVPFLHESGELRSFDLPASTLYKPTPLV